MKSFLLCILILSLTNAIPAKESDAKDQVDQLLKQFPFVVFGTTWCSDSRDVQRILRQYRFDRSENVYNYTMMDLNGEDQENRMTEAIVQLSGNSHIPQVFVNGKFFGTDKEIRRMHSGKTSKGTTELYEFLNERGFLNSPVSKPNKSIHPEYKDGKQFVESMIQRPLFVMTATWCPYSRKAKRILSKYNLIKDKYAIVDIDEYKEEEEIYKYTKDHVSHGETIPQIFFRRKYKGGSDEVDELDKSGELRQELKNLGVIL